MASNDDGTAGALGAGLLLGLLGGVIVGAALTSQVSPQAAFEQQLRASLGVRGLTLAAARLGQGAAGPVWVVTVRFADGSVGTVNAACGSKPPFDLALADDIAGRISTALSANAA